MFENYEKLPEDKRKTIFYICMDSFIENGYSLANTVEMAKQCGIAKGSLFHYFRNKKALFLYIVRACIETIMSETRLALAAVHEQRYFDRVRKSVEIKIALPMTYPKETALLARAFSERGHEASGELFSMMMDYTKELKALSSQYIGEIEPQLVHEGIAFDDACGFIQIVFDGLTSRIMLKYSQKPSELLNDPKILSGELEKAIAFILHGIGR